MQHRYIINLLSLTLTLLFVLTPAAFADSTVQDMDEDRLARVASTLDISQQDFLAAIEVDFNLESLEMDRNPASAAADLANRVDEEIDRLVENGEFNDSKSLGGRAVALDINRRWDRPFGLDWLNLDGVTVVGEYGQDSSLYLSLIGYSEVAGVPTTTHITFLVDNAGQTVEVSTSIDALTLGELSDLLALSGLSSPFESAVADDAMTFRDLDVTFTFGDTFDFTITGATTLINTIEADAMFSLVPTDAETTQVILGLRVYEFTLADLYEDLYGTVAAEITFPEVAFSYAHEAGTIPSANLSDAAWDFYQPVLGNEFTLELTSGMNFDGALPLHRLPSNLVDAIGMDENDVLTAKGTLDISIELLTPGTPVKLTGFTLEASLPPAEDVRLPRQLRSMYTIKRSLRFSYVDETFSVGITNILRTEIDGAIRTFDLAADAQATGDESSLNLSGHMRGEWSQPFGLNWLTLENVRLSTTVTGRNVHTALQSTFDVGDKSMDMTVMMEKNSSGQRRVTVQGRIDEFATSEIRGLLARIFPNAVLFDGEAVFDVPFKDVVMTVGVGKNPTFSMRAATTIRDQEAEVMLSAVRKCGSTRIVAGFRLDEFALAEAMPTLQGTLVADMGLQFPGATIIVANNKERIDESLLGPHALDFYREAYGSDDFDLNLQRGVNLVSNVQMPQNEITDKFSALGVGGDDNLLVTGSLPSGFLSGGSSGLLSDLSLRVALPPMSPPGAPEWFVSGQLGLEITGRPSVGLVGELTVKLEGDVLTFFVEGNVARSGANLSLALTGGLSADEPWDSPFGIEWLVFNDARLKLSVNATGSLGLGFAGDMVVGEKDIDTAVFIAVNMATGVPTNFIFEGQSEAGVSLGDLAKLQQRMASASLPGSRTPALSIDRLPDVIIRNVHLKFAPKDDPDLGVERGLTVQGDCWTQSPASDDLTLIGSIDLSIDESGIDGSGRTGAIDFGPIRWDEADVSLIITLAEQELTMSGSGQIGPREFVGDVQLTRDGFEGERFNQCLENVQAAREAARQRAIAAREALRRAIAARRIFGWR